MQNHRDGTLVYFYHEGGVKVGNVDEKASKFIVPINETLTANMVEKHLLVKLGDKKPAVSAEGRKVITEFLCQLHAFYMDYNFAFLEINPFVFLEKTQKIVVMDCAAKLDSAAHYAMAEKWGENYTFPPPFGKTGFKEEAAIRALDEKTGASLKLTVLNIKGRIWTMVAGGGASVVYTDCITNFGGAAE